LLKFALFVSQEEFVLAKSFQYQSCDVAMLCSVLCEDEDVVEIHANDAFHDEILKMSFIIVWKVEGELVSPKNITRGL
jgi:hypothetical protein